MNELKEYAENNKTKALFVQNSLDILTIILIVIGLIPFLMLVITGNPGTELFQYIFGRKLIKYIPCLDELIFYIGITMICIALTHFFIRVDFAKKLIFCEIFIVLLIYFADVVMIIPSGSGQFVEMISNGVQLLLMVGNHICFYIIYRYSNNIKVSYFPSIVGVLNTILFIFAIQLNATIFSYNDYKDN